MSVRTCPHCRGHVSPGEERCRWCGAPLPAEVPAFHPGDLLRIRNPFKNGHVEDVTVVSVERGGYGLAVRDSRGLVWALIKPTDVVAVLRRARAEAAG
ncbi:MAG: hypothetical protein L6E13_04210 [Firmicutes bacterium]|nr:hypothetical protein [Bacillota bacterium]